MINGEITETNDEGFLIVTVVNGLSQIERNGAVCNLNWRAAHLFCQSLGFMFADWGTSSSSDKYGPE